MNNANRDPTARLAASAIRQDATPVGTQLVLQNTTN